jgi:hypothetical protein
MQVLIVDDDSDALDPETHSRCVPRDAGSGLEA